ncbi:MULTISPECIES: DMT family transporter [Streptomyces]|uniref:DMT family transporter n=1 Tax=Streptomyces flaveolus TaxID=67297 RepID=A0ABV3AN81_9ACTN|nr:MULTISPECIES: DMT family transporter [Streptomyces]
MALSVLLCLVSALSYALAARLQERAAATARRTAGALRSGPWWASLTLNGGGALLHVLALRWGPLTLVQPLGVLTIVFALAVAAFGRERRAAGRTVWAGAGLVSAGLAGLGSLVEAGPGVVPSGRDQVLIAALGCAGLTALAGLAARVRRAAGRSAVLATAAGVAFGIASVHTKAVVDGWGVLAPRAEAAGVALTALMAVAGLAASQASYRGGGLVVPLVTATLVNPAVAALIGVTALDDGFRYGTAGLFCVASAAGMATVGLLMLAGERAAPGTAGRRTAAPVAVSAVSHPPVRAGESPVFEFERGRPCPKTPCVSQ